MTTTESKSTEEDTLSTKIESHTQPSDATEDQATTDSQKKQSEHNSDSFAEDPTPLSDRLQKASGRAARFTSQAVKKTTAIIKGDYSIALSPYAAYCLRVLAIITLVLAFIDPVFSVGGTGLIAWLQTFVINLLVVFGLFVIAEVVLIQRDIADALEAIADSQTSNNSEWVTDDDR